MIVGHIGGSSSGGYEIQKSLRFRASASAYLSRTPTVAGNRKTWTWSGWVKRGALVDGTLFKTTAGVQYDFFYFLSDALSYQLNTGTNYVYTTSALFRDPSAHMHIVLSVDTTQAADADRVRIYVNGTLQARTAGGIPQNTDTYANAAPSVPHNIGSNSGVNTHLDGYLSEINFIDGQALNPSNFGQVSAETGAWIPKKYTGTYGTNGFYLPFNDGSTLASLAADRSGNGNNWTANNFSLTSGSSYDSMTDVPTLTSATAANYCVLNPLSNAGCTISDANLTVQKSGASWGIDLGTTAFPASGKFYFETTIISSSSGNNQQAGISDASASNGFQLDCFYSTNLIRKVVNGTVTTGYGTAANGTVISVAVDADNGKAYLAINNTWIDSSSPTGGTGGYSMTSGAQYFPYFGGFNSGQTAFNFGQRPFTYSPPAGFKALCTKNLPEVPASLLDPTDHHIDITVTKSGDTNFTLPWDASVYDTFFEIKRRDASGDWYQIDGLRGYDKILKSNSTAAETTDANVLGVSGTTCTLKSTLPNGVYIISATKAGLSSARQTNTDGSITSTVSRNVDSGFAIVAATSNGADPFTMGHGLGVPPKMVVFKNRDGVDGFYVAHTGLTNMSSYWLVMNTTAAVASGTAIFGAGPTSTTVGIRGTSLAGNGSKVVLYCYADSAIQKSFSYKGNGSTDGPYVNLGFKCGRSLWKRSSGGSSNWSVLDSARDTFNVADNPLLPNSDVAEQTSTPTAYAHADLLALSMKVRGNSSDINNSGSDTYIGHAWAAVTGKYSNAR